MARALFDREGWGCDSAGLRPGDGIHPFVIEAMREVGIDLGGARPKAITRALVEEANVVVRCIAPDPDDWDWPLGPRYVDWVVPMPADEDAPTLDEIRRLRAAIHERVHELLRTMT